jgi:hypothetical protein
MHAAWVDKGYWRVAPRLFHHFCLAVWYHQHARILDFTSHLPPDRTLLVRSEDILNRPARALAKICRRFGLGAGPAVIEAMSHPERSPYARIGPEGAVGGWDERFMRDPRLRPAKLPRSLDPPAEWVVDPWLGLACRQLASSLGYA